MNLMALKTWKPFAAVTLLLSSLSAFASESHIPKEIGLSKNCEKTILQFFSKVADNDSDAAEHEDRMHDPYLSQTGIDDRKPAKPNTFYLEYYAGDADPYTYYVTIANKEKCTFSYVASR